MRKDTPEFIKKSNLIYVKKICKHHYQHKDGTIMLLIPYKDENFITLKFKEDSVINVSFDKSYNKNYSKSITFICYRNTNPVTSIKKYKRHKELISKVLEWLKDNEIDTSSYVDMSQKIIQLRNYLNQN